MQRLPLPRVCRTTQECATRESIVSRHPSVFYFFLAFNFLAALLCSLRPPTHRQNDEGKKKIKNDDFCQYTADGGVIVIENTVGISCRPEHFRRFFRSLFGAPPPNTTTFVSVVSSFQPVYFSGKKIHGISHAHPSPPKVPPENRWR